MATTNTQRQAWTIKASVVARLHTYLALTAFLSALFLGCLLHYKKIVKNGVAGYPEEWFPSVSAAIGDWYPERCIFHILIALTSGPRFGLVVLHYYLSRSSATSLPFVVLLSGLVRTISCGGWVYITSTDDHDVHDILMITYIVCNIPWMFGGIVCAPEGNETAKRRRKAIAAVFFVSLVPLIYFFIQHKIHRVPGAYTRYAFFEWSLIIADILYDSVNELDFQAANLEITIAIPLGDSRSNELYKSNTTTVEHVLDDDMKATKQIASKSDSVEDLPDRVNKKNDSDMDSSKPHQTRSPLVSVFGIGTSCRPAASFLSDVYLAYIFWSILTSLAPTLFYFSVWELGIAGHELALLSLLSPIVLQISPLLTLARSRSGRITLHVLSLAGLAAYKLDDPLHRLWIVAFANVISCIGAAIDWSGAGDHNINVEYQGILLGLGLIISSLSKHANHSNNPIWPFVNSESGGHNKSGFFLALLAIWELSTRFSNRTSTPNHTDTAKVKQLTFVKTSSSGSWLPHAISLGALLFSLQCLLTDSSTLIAWSWTGYPIHGPVPNLHGHLTLIAQCIGLLVPVILSPSLSTVSVLKHPLWFMFGSSCSLILYHYKDWSGYMGGIGLAIFLMSLIPNVLQCVSRREQIGKIYFTAWLVVILLDLANIWTVAYAFVPGGDYLRERSDLVLIAQILFMAPAFAWTKSSLGQMNVKSDITWTTKPFVYALLATIPVLSILSTTYRLPVIAPQPFKPGPRIIHAGIWTLHFGIDNQGKDSQRRARDLIKDMELDIVGLLETDLHRIVFGNRDLTRVLSEELGYYVDLGPGPNQHTWGAVLLSKFPIINSTHHLLPSPRGELAPCISAVLDVWGTKITVVVAHNGQEEDPLDRELQSKEIARIMAEVYPQPVIFLGYLVTKPHAPHPAPYDILVKDGRVHDIDSLDYDRWCEYIFYRGLYRTAYARVSRSTITDTELQIGQFVVPRQDAGVINDSEEARYFRARKEDLPTSHWFPMEYYGDENEGGKNGHFYHVFYTPLYYKIPE